MDIFFGGEGGVSKVKKKMAEELYFSVLCIRERPSSTKTHDDKSGQKKQSRDSYLSHIVHILIIRLHSIYYLSSWTHKGVFASLGSIMKILTKKRRRRGSR